MKKIYTITCHEVYNHGASLQEYALLRFLNNRGYDAVTINYQPDYLANNYKLFKVPLVYNNKGLIYRLAYVLAKLPSKLETLSRYRKFESFTERYIPSTKQMYKDNEELKLLVPDADVYICGSDQIWNTLFTNGRDKAFYLDFAPKDALKISYAASFATSKIENGLEQFVKNQVQKLDAVSVRESSAVKILQELGIESKQVLDPVFLLDKEHWVNKFIEKEQKLDKYVFVYDFDNNEAIKAYATHLSKKYKLKIYSTNKLSYADKSFWNEGPIKFLNLVFNAEFVLTNSFHALAFSLIFEKQVFVFNRSTSINTRMFDLLSLFNLTYRMVDSKSIKDINEITFIDYAKLETDFKLNVKNSKEFLLKVLN